MALLGNRAVEGWDEDVGEPKDNNDRQRESLVGQMNKRESDRKRKMHSDRWDSLLDQGKTKKTKSKPNVSTEAPIGGGFQRLQASLQRMNRGKAKGAFRKDGRNESKQKHRFFNKKGKR